ncbi:hypothetical protein [Mesorhizobium sp. M0011]|uniref:hypothetical protein n=1 Tax=Mesorhizobium sp. M0011 TaxID=2956839 RepID=UPI00333A286A
MTLPPPPQYDKRRRAELEKELLDRARMWLPEWHALTQAGDAGAAVLKIAAQLESQVTQRLDRVPEKSFRGFLDWVGVRGKAGRAARIPLAFHMAAHSEPVLAQPPIQMQADAGGQPVIFETSVPVQVVPAALAAVFGAEPKDDRFYGPFVGLSPWEAPKPAPSEWRLLASARAKTTKLQLDPPTGLAEGMIIEDPAKNRFRIKEAKDGLVTIEPGVGEVEIRPSDELIAATNLDAGSVLRRVTAFDPFSAAERNQQRHALYLGSEGGLDIKTAALIEVTGDSLPEGWAWCYWGKDDKDATDKDADWIELKRAEDLAPGLYLKKESGPIESLEIDGRPSRWIRATSPGGSSEKASLIHGLGLRVNCLPEIPKSDDKEAEQQRKNYKDYLKPPAEKFKIEGIANTAPLVMDQAFYPLGREPRLFDSFYLGCEQAFSKPGAEVTIRVETGEDFSGPIVSAELQDKVTIVAGVTSDKRLRVIKIENTDPATPPNFYPPLIPNDSTGRPLNLTAGRRPGAAKVNNTVYISAAVGKEVWLWAHGPDGGVDKGLSLGIPGDASDVTDTVLIPSDGSLLVYAVSAGRVYSRDALGSSDWTQMEAAVPEGAGPLTRLAAGIDHTSAQRAPSATGDLVAVTSLGRPLILVGGKWIDIGRKDAKTQYPTSAYPLLVSGKDRRTVFAAVESEIEIDRKKTIERKVVAINAFDPAAPTEQQADLGLIGGSFGLAGSGEAPIALFFGTDDTKTTQLCIWTPSVENDPVQTGPAILGGASLKGAPVPCFGRYVIPQDGGAITIAEVLTIKTLTDAELRSVVVSTDRVDVGEYVIAFAKSGDNYSTIAEPERVLDAKSGGTIFLLKDAVQGSAERKAYVFRSYGPDNPIQIEADKDVYKLVLGDDSAIKKDDSLYLNLTKGGPSRIAVVTDIDKGLATLSVAISKGWTGVYRKVVGPEEHRTSLRSALRLKGIPGIIWPSDQQIEIEAKVFRINDVADDGEMKLLVLSGRVYPEPVRLIAELHTAFGGETSYAPSQPSNPELSWEFWDGQSWWKIPEVKDGTRNLVSTGDIVLTVPDGLKKGDVVGRTNHWIRARLIGGDYGQEKVTLTTTDPLDGSHTQTVTRDPSSVRAPYVVNISISYKLCTPLSPDLVLTQDNGGYRDQTDANTAPNAQVQVFTPLKNALPKTGVRLVKGGVAASGCDCGGAAADDAISASDDHEAELDRAIYLGFDASLKGGSITLLVLVEEGAFDGAFPLVVEAFADGIFARVPVKDGTRGLSETGILTLSLPEELREARYFGQTMYWLRLKPKFGFEGTWQPRIRAVYLNAAFADAVETQKQEVLGSSDGSPDQKVSVARPPVVEGSLELRVREPLGDEEIDELLKADPESVLTEVGPWQGAWVRWTQDTLAAADAKARVFELAAADGQVTFGNGKHGRIPPIGRDNIVAVSYQRGGGDAANQVPAWGQINLITPIGGVDTTIAPEGAAGGSSPQGPEIALRFAPTNLRMRDRALTIGDIEQLALQSSPDIAQVKALRTDAGVRVVQVMRGRLPLPTNAARRELRRYLIERMPPFLSIVGALVVETPAIVAGSIALKITVADLAEGGSVADEAIKRVVALLDPATGGIDGLGWRLGASPDESDITAQLMANKRLPGIKGLVDVQSAIVTHAAKGARPLKPSELFVVRDDDVSVTTVVDEEVGA